MNMSAQEAADGMVQEDAASQGVNADVDAGADVDVVRAAVRHLFRKSESDRATRAFFETVLEYRLEKLE